MIKSAVTVSLVEEARGGPFVFWDGLADACQRAAELGFDAIEVFAPGPDAVQRQELEPLLEQHGLQVAAVGTGGGMVKHGLSLTDPDPQRRQQAVDFVKSMIDFGATYRAPAIIGSMQGRWGGDVSRATALQFLAQALEQLGDYAAQFDLPLLYEPLNRYETNLFTNVVPAAEFVAELPRGNVKILADLFHMNIEEADIAQAITDGGSHIGHVHFVDSNRRATGLGHMQYEPIVAALKEIGYDGYLSAEAFPLPDSMTAAMMTIDTFRKFFRD
ncbi:MAG: sugar phosphate isomerase/epimerase [Planctomycetota bacterium]|nr:MAG: sugar phosphate isomerase/epimerase [Planctomycetota bacterium]